MISKSTRAAAERCTSLPFNKGAYLLYDQIHRSARVRPTSGETRATQRGGLYDLQDTSETTIKSWLRTLVVLGDQNRSQTIDRHASGLQASGETRATHKEEDYALQSTSRITPKSRLRTLVVLDDQNRSQTIDRHASGLQASGETRATHKEEDYAL
jgi:hypothetical protein